MPPRLALLLTTIFILGLFIRDIRQKPNVSRALWIPYLWIMILGSRSVSQWIYLGPPVGTQADNLIEGSPLDRTVFLLLMIAGFLVLCKRRISWSSIFRDNIFLTLFFLYCGMSMLWSDFPSVAFKRWFKALGDPIMVIILLTEPEPVKAIETVFKRCAYILLPLSVLFIKYYPELGKDYDPWTGVAFYTGVTTNKNSLGVLCLVLGLYFVCTFFAQWRQLRESGKRLDVLIVIIFLFMIQWLFGIADSKTPLMGLILAILVVAGLGFTRVKRGIGSYVVVGILTFTILELSFNFSEVLIQGAGRDTTLTGRTDLWQSVLKMNTNPLIGAGFESFWLGERLTKLWEEFFFRPNQAHNGYLEIYLNLGWVGLFFLSGMIISCYYKIQKSLKLSVSIAREERRGFDFDKFGLGYLLAYLIYNITEGAFKELTVVFVTFLLVAIKCPLPSPGSIHSPPASSLRGTRKASKWPVQRYVVTSPLNSSSLPVHTLKSSEHPPHREVSSS
jgi:O-antigen ligase